LVDIVDLAEQVKDACKIEEVIAATPGFSVSGHGRYLTAVGPDGHDIVVDTRNGAFHYHYIQDHGDVINWVKNRYGWDFQTAIEYLCKFAGLAAPDWKKESPEKRMFIRARQDIYECAVKIFEQELWANDAALAYVRSRGWTDETIKAARLGYTGDSKDRARMFTKVHDEIVLNGGDPLSVAGVTILGLNKDIRRWMDFHSLEIEEDWVSRGFTTSFIARDLIVYPHFDRGKCVYLSGRYLTDHYDAKGKKKKSINLPVILAGSPQIYQNWLCSPSEDQYVIVEGQADAITLGQWGYPAKALNGTTLNESTAKTLGVGGKKNISFFLALDDDDPGQKKILEKAALLGPMTRLVKWCGVGGIDTYIDPKDGIEKEVKDANDLLRGFQQ
jgi:DNA primase